MTRLQIVEAVAYFFILFLLHWDVSAEREQPYAIVCFEYAIISTHQVLLDSLGHI